MYLCVRVRVIVKPHCHISGWFNNNVGDKSSLVGLQCLYDLNFFPYNAHTWTTIATWGTWFKSLIRPGSETVHYILTHFNWLWSIVNNVGFLRNYVIGKVYLCTYVSFVRQCSSAIDLLDITLYTVYAHNPSLIDLKINIHSVSKVINLFIGSEWGLGAKVFVRVLLYLERHCR